MKTLLQEIIPLQEQITNLNNEINNLIEKYKKPKRVKTLVDIIDDSYEIQKLYSSLIDLKFAVLKYPHERFRTSFNSYLSPSLPDFRLNSIRHYEKSIYILLYE